MEHKKCCFISRRAMEFSFGLDEDDSRCIATKAHIKEVIKSLLEQGGDTLLYVDDSGFRYICC